MVWIVDTQKGTIEEIGYEYYITRLTAASVPYSVHEITSGIYVGLHHTTSEDVVVQRFTDEEAADAWLFAFAEREFDKLKNQPLIFNSWDDASLYLFGQQTHLTQEAPCGIAVTTETI